MNKVDVRKRFLQLAHSQLNPKSIGIENLEQALCNWYMFQYNVPPNDDKMLSMTLEELFVLRQMHNLRDNPQLAEELDSSQGSYEEWLKKEMGDEYESPEELLAREEEQEKIAKEEEDRLIKDLPTMITTDFRDPLIVGSEE